MADRISNQTPGFIHPEEASVRWVKWFETRDGKRFFKSGFTTHDQAIGAFLRGSLTLIAARPGIGKTAFLFALAYRLIQSRIKAYYCNLEMPVEAMWNRLACLHDPEITLRELTQGELTDREVKRITVLAAELIGFSPIFFEGTDFRQLIKKTIDTISPSSDSCLFVDYVGLFTLAGLGPQERYWLISECAKGLKLLARQLDIPVIAAVQLNRQLENRTNKTPTLADLRDSGELENHADTVLALTRDEKDTLIVDCLKNRNGPLASYSLAFDGPRVAVEEFD